MDLHPGGTEDEVDCVPAHHSPKHPGSHKRATPETSGSPGADFDCVNGLALPSSTVHPEFVSPPSSDQDIYQPDTYPAVFHYLLLHALDLERSYLMAIDQRPNSRGETAVNTSIGLLCCCLFLVDAMLCAFRHPKDLGFG